MEIPTYQQPNYALGQSRSFVPKFDTSTMFGQNWGTPGTSLSDSGYHPANFALGQSPGASGFGNMIGAPGTGGGGDVGGGFFDNFLTKNGNQGWGGMAFGAAQGLGNAYLGSQQLAVAKDTLANNKKQFDLNFKAQKQATNSALEDRQRARVSANSGGYESVGSYMSKNAIA